MEAALKGLLLGTTISFMIGPIFFGLVDITISKGWRCGLGYIFGVIVSDVVLIFLVDRIFSKVDFVEYQFYIGVVGGIVLLVFGMITFLSKVSVKGIDVKDIKTILQAFAKGITINVLNPFVILWWIGLYSTTSSSNYTSKDKFLYYFSFLLMVFLFDLLKMRFAYFIKYKLSIEKIAIVKKFAGVALFIFGIVLIVRVLI